MVSCFISRIVILIFGTLYPAYASYKAVRTKNVKEYVKWMMYWIVFALFTCAETFTDLFLSFWFPFYYEIKIITVIYLLSPATKGSSILYRKFVHPVLIKREQEIDEYIAKAKEQGYHTMLNLGSKGVTYATSLIMQTAIKGGGGLVNQLRKSYSLSDLSEEQHSRSQTKSRDDVDSRHDEDHPRVGRRLPAQSPRRTISNPSQAGLYFPEVDIFQRPLSLDEESYYSQIPSSEEISSGYSSGDPLYYGVQRPKGDHLVRTASLGGSNRIRTRAATKAGLPKRSSLAEGGSTWSSMEPRDSQIEPDEFFHHPLTHSSSLPLSFTPLSNFVPSEFQHMLENITQKQIFTVVNQSAYLPFFNGNFKNNSENDFNELNPSVVISEVQKVVEDSSLGQKPEENSSTDNSDKKFNCQNQNIKVLNLKEKELMTTSSKINDSGEGFINPEDKENLYLERSGKYNKKPAPTPPREDLMPKIKSGEDEGLEFFTPNASPKLERKIDSDPVSKSSNDNIIKALDLLEVPRKDKSKGKKKDFQISKKLHLPKMNFPFWHQKSGKHSSGSESSSVASVEIAGGRADGKNELEYFIPLKKADDQNVEQKGKNPN